jgi:hypothetical protein
MTRERFDFGVLVSPDLLALRQTWTTPPAQVDHVPAELAEFAGAQAEGDRQDEQGRQAPVRVYAGVEAELPPARAAGYFAEVWTQLSDRRFLVRSSAAGEGAAVGRGVGGPTAVLLPKAPSDLVTANRAAIGEGDQVIPLAGIWRDERFPRRHRAGQAPGAERLHR